MSELEGKVAIVTGGDSLADQQADSRDDGNPPRRRSRAHPRCCKHQLAEPGEDNGLNPVG